jgi:hypothetical protein
MLLTPPPLVAAGVLGALATEPPPAFVEAADTVAQPAIGGRDSPSGSVFTQWSAWRSPATRQTLLLGCVATPIPGWVEDMRPTVDARTIALLDTSAERVVGAPVETRAVPGHLALRAVGAPEGAPWVGIGRTFVGFGEHEVLTCFAACAVPKDGAGTAARACDASVLAARLEGDRAPPPSGIVLGGLTWAIHHPATAVTWGGVLAFALGVVAVVSRRRPRSRI